MNILITNFHSIKNKGDLGIVQGLIHGLKNEYPGAIFSILGRYEEERSWWQAQGINFYLPLLTYGPRAKPNNPSWFTTKRWAATFLFDYFLSLLITRSKNALRWYYRNKPEAQRTLEGYLAADIIISKGGSFFREPDYNVNILPIGILGHLHQLMIGHRLRKKVILSSQSFGPINNPFSRWIVGRAFRTFALITVRDTDSKRFLNTKLNVVKNVSVVGDSAFLLAPSTEEGSWLTSFRTTIETGKRQGLRYVGVTVRNWSHKDQFIQYKQAITELISLHKNTHRFIFMPQVIGPSIGEDDRRVSDEIITQLDTSIRLDVINVTNDLEPTELVKLYGMMDYFVATRLHSSIFALLASVPVIAIGYEPKTIGIFSDIGLNSYVLDIRALNGTALNDAFGQLENVSPKTFINACNAAMAAAKLNIEAIRKVISE